MRGPTGLGRGVPALHPDGVTGRVVGRFRHGCYVGTPAGVYAVAGPAIPCGPLHLVVDVPPRVGEGDPVRRSGDRLQGPGWVVDLAGVGPYAPWLPRPGDPEQLVRLAQGLSTLTDPLPTDLHGCWPGVRDALVRRDLVAAARTLAGRGGGLTPAGDDVVAGLLLARAWIVEDEESADVVAAVAARTTDLSRGFLHWAERGESIAPVHDLGRSVAVGDAAGAAEAAARVRRIGASSGAALLFGLATGARLARLRRRLGGAPSGAGSR